MRTQTLDAAAAQREYYARPADERFGSLAELITQAQADRDSCAERKYNLKDLIAEPTQTGIMLHSPKGGAQLNAWSFGQLARTIGAPASYLKTLPPELIARNVNHGLHASEAGTTANLLVRDSGQGDPLIRACTSETYGRAWDAQLYSALDRQFGDGKQSQGGGQWMTPPAWPGSLPSGNYRGDRDSFVIRVDGGSIVQDPSRRNSQDGGQMFRGLLIRNSEVGAASITLQAVLFRFICGNHMLWGAIMDRSFARRHVGENAARDTIREMATLAWKFNSRTASQDEAIIQSLIDHEIAHTQAAVVDELKKMGATKQQAEDAYAACEVKESASPRSFWGIAQGLTRVSQTDGYQDERLALDKLAAQVLSKGAKQYAMA